MGDDNPALRILAGEVRAQKDEEERAAKQARRGKRGPKAEPIKGIILEPDKLRDIQERQALLQSKKKGTE